MAIKREYERRLVPEGYYECRFTGVKQIWTTGFTGSEVERSIWQFVGHPVEGDEEESYEITVWVSNSMALNAHQRKLMERMGGVTVRDAVGALTVRPAEIDLQDEAVQELCDTNCAAWEGERFLVRVQNGTRADGSPTSFSNVDDVYRAEGEPALLPLKGPQQAAAQTSLPTSGRIRKGRQAATAEAPASSEAASEATEDKPVLDDPFAED